MVAVVTTTRGRWEVWSVHDSIKEARAAKNELVARGINAKLATAEN